MALKAAPCRFGGVRWWWVCPATGRRAAKLYLPVGGALPLAAGVPAHLRLAVEFTLVPYNGNHPSLTALVRGDVDLASDSPFAARSLLEQGTIRAVATTGAQRSPVMPDVPAFAETVPGYEVMFWGGLLAPGGTPEPILDRLNREVDAVLRLPDVAERVRSFGAEPVGGSRVDYARMIAADRARWGTVVRETGVRGD